MRWEPFQLWESESTGEILTYSCNINKESQGLGFSNVIVGVSCLLLHYICYALPKIVNAVHVPLASETYLTGERIL